jgi:hypothetical protein
MNKISFIHIKPNSNKEHFNLINDNVFKIANSYDSSFINKEIENIIDDLQDILVLKTEVNPILYINTFYNNKYNNNNEKSYDIMSYDKINDRYYLLIYDNLLNSSKYLSLLDDNIRNKEFNLLGSNLIKCYSNTVLFGDLFVLSIDRSYYDLLLNLDKNRDIELLLNKYNKIYFDITLYDLIISYKNTNYIKIYVKSLNNTYIYQKDIINALITINYELIPNNIIKINNNNLDIYVKKADILPDSHHQILESIKDYNLNNEFNLVNISEEDILYLLGK